MPTLFPGLSGWAPAIFTQIAITSAASFFYHLLDIPRHLPVMQIALPSPHHCLSAVTGRLPCLCRMTFSLQPLLALALLILVAPATFILYRRGLRRSQKFCLGIRHYAATGITPMLLGRRHYP